MQILCTLCDEDSFFEVFASDLLLRSVTKPCTVIVNADSQTKGGSQRLVIHFRHKSSGAYYFDSHGIVPLVPEVLAFIRRICITWVHNRGQLQSISSDVCGKYSFLFASYILQFVAFLDACIVARQVDGMFAAEFGTEMPRYGWGQCCRSCI